MLLHEEPPLSKVPTFGQKAMSAKGSPNQTHTQLEGSGRAAVFFVPNLQGSHPTRNWELRLRKGCRTVPGIKCHMAVAVKNQWDPILG